MNSILKNSITLGIGIIIGSFFCHSLFTYATDRNDEIKKSNELITLIKEVINEKNYYSVSSNNMLFINETLNYEIYSCENLMYNVVLTDTNNEQYSYDFIDTEYGTYYLGNGYEYTQQTSISTGSFTVEDVWKPNYSVYENTFDNSDYQSMCKNIFHNLKSDEIDILAVYAINSFPWNKSTQGTPVLLILENEAIISNAIQSPDGYIVDRMNCSLSKSDAKDLIDRYLDNYIDFAIS